MKIRIFCTPCSLELGTLTTEKELEEVRPELEASIQCKCGQTPELQVVEE